MPRQHKDGNPSSFLEKTISRVVQGWVDSDRDWICFGEYAPAKIRAGGEIKNPRSEMSGDFVR